MKLVLASHNQGKLQELSAILEPAVAGLELVSYDGPEPIEDGTSYLENALIKARAAHAHTGLPAIADDSGIAVEILGGSPGIFTAIWSGTRDNAANRQLLLAQLKDIHEEHRAAAFVCTIALVSEDGEQSFTGIWPGRVAHEERGEFGHGYDPVFIPEGFEVTAAELPPEVKNSMSHRAMALQQLIA
ncbi:MAG: RdgB/HAM1 family non-canonical purine NTP pyrophosphatase, partial [Rhodoluna sp.]|nr:RdgB/HAM1 family non-canonical purine NTP pyrophosphatase [Rhodoluna sp.]